MVPTPSKMHIVNSSLNGTIFKLGSFKAIQSPLSTQSITTHCIALLAFLLSTVLQCNASWQHDVS